MRQPLASILLVCAAAVLVAGCGNTPSGSVQLRSMQFTDPLRAMADDQPSDPNAPKTPAAMRGARNEIVSFALQIDPVPAAASNKPAVLRISPLKRQGAAKDTSAKADAPAGLDTVAADAYTAYQVITMPINTNHAGFVRHTGLPVSTHMLPRALLPLNVSKGEIDLGQLRDANDPANPALRAAGKTSATVWIDVAIPALAQPGEYQATAECVEDGRTVATYPISLTVYDFVLPDERHLLMVGQLNWESLVRLYPETFAAITPEYLTRKDPKYAAAVKTLDQFVQIAHQHRADLSIPRLTPVVKWGFNRNVPPAISWEDYDSVVGEWLSGAAFADHIPLSFWPMPKTPQHDQLQPDAQKAYWQAVASHFDQNEWIGRAAVVIDHPGGGRVQPHQAMQISSDAANALSASARLRVSVPVEETQIGVAQELMPNLIRTNDLARVLAAAPALVTSELADGKGGTRAGLRWLRTDLEGLVPYVGAGADERETRLWAWLAFLRDAQLIQWPAPLPSRADAKAPADPDELVWFYPGSWFGTDQPVPSIQLKWLRRAQQDYEYLLLAKTRGQLIQARVIARLLTKPVEIELKQAKDPVYALVCGTSDAGLWTQALELLSRIIQLRTPGQPVDTSEEASLTTALLTWMAPQERPMLLGRTTTWSFGTARQGGIDLASIDVRLGIDIYNAADTRPEKNKLQWTSVPPAWQIAPNPVLIPELSVYHVTHAPMDAKVRLDRVVESTRQPLDITFINGDDKREMLLRLMIPVAKVDQREGRAPTLDGSLEDWAAEDCIHNGKFVRMLSRPAIQRQELQFAPVPSQLYSTFTANDFYLAFRLEGVEAPSGAVGKATVDNYQFRRAWGEDLAEVLMQPVYEDNTFGPVVHMIFRPGGQIEIRRKVIRKNVANPLAPVTGADVRYVATVREVITKDPLGKEKKDNIWRGELALPWSMVLDPEDNNPNHKLPALLRFNFVQHRNASGESASWAGPIDFGRDETFTGLLHLRAFRRAGPVEVPRIGVKSE